MSLIQHYLTVRSYSYQIFENHLLPYIKSLLYGDLTYKDLSMLFQLQNLIHENKNRPTDIASNAHIAINNLSYRLTRLASNDLIIKKTGEKDHRETFIYIAPKGYDLLDIYRALYTQFSDELKTQLNPRELIALVRGWTKVSNAFSEAPKIRFNPLKVKMYPQWLQIAGTRFYNVIIDREETLLKTHKIDIALREWTVLVEIYLQSQRDTCTLSDLKNQLPYPISTLSTIVTRYEGTYVKKIKNKDDHRMIYLTIHDTVHKAFDDYLTLRLDIEKTIDDLLSQKEYAVLVKAFESIRTITQMPEPSDQGGTYE